MISFMVLKGSPGCYEEWSWGGHTGDHDSRSTTTGTCTGVATLQMVRCGWILDIFWKQSQEDLLMYWMWRMRKKEKTSRILRVLDWATRRMEMPVTETRKMAKDQVWREIKISELHRCKILLSIQTEILRVAEYKKSYSWEDGQEIGILGLSGYNWCLK